jgi:hypothetical protein
MKEDAYIACVGRCDQALKICVNRGPADETDRCERIFSECERACDRRPGGPDG